MSRPFVTLLHGAHSFSRRASAALLRLALLKSIVFAVALGLFGTVGDGFAQEQRQLAGAESDKIDAVLLLDTSGSMLATDPKSLRYEGAKLFINLLRPGDRVAIIAFDKDARVVSPFISHDDAAATKNLDEMVSKLTASGIYTDLLSGIEVAGDFIKANKRPDATAIILLLSDGKMDPDPAIGTASFRSEQLLNAVLPDLKSNSVKVNTIYFSEQADQQLLSEIALASEGASAFATSVDVIHKSFADLFLAVKKPQVVPLTGRGFSIDDDVQEATFYLNRAEGQELVLSAPGGNEIRSNTTDSAVKWFVGQRFDVVTIESPEAGSWRVAGLASADGFATVLTNLKLVSDWPNNVTAAEPTLLQVRLNEGDKPVELKEVSSNTRYGVQIVPTDKVAEPILEEPLYDDGTHGDKIAGDGIFSHRIALENPGDYRMWLVAKGPTFDRRQQLPFKVKPPLIQIVVTREDAHSAEAGSHGEAAADHGGHDEHGGHPEGANAEHGHGEAEHADVADKENNKEPLSSDEEVRVLVRLSTEVLGFKNVRVSMMAIDEGRKRYLIPVEKGHDATEYEVAMKAFPHDGMYELEATLKAEAKKRGEINAESRPVKVAIVRGVDAPPVTALAVGETAPVPPSPWPYVGGLLLLNGAATAFLFLLLKKQQKGGAVTLPAFIPATAAKQFLEMLQQRAAMTEIDLADPSLQGAVAQDSTPTATESTPAAKVPTPPPAPESQTAEEQATDATPPPADELSTETPTEQAPAEGATPEQAPTEEKS